MKDKHIKQSPMLTLPSLGGGSNSPLVRRAVVSEGPQDPHPGSWNFDINTLGFMGKSPNYRWRAQTTSQTCGVFLKPDGTSLFILSQDGILRRHIIPTAYDLGTAYYSQKLSLSLSSASSGRGVVFKTDGTQFFYLDNNIIKSYTLSTAWDLYSASIASSNVLNVSSNLTNSNNSVSLNWKPDGTKVYVAESDGNSDNFIHQWSVSVAWNLTTASYDYSSPHFDSSIGSFSGRVKGFNFKADGTEIYTTHNNNMRIAVWPLTTAWNVNTRGSRSNYPRYYEVVESFDANGSNIQWKSDGSVYYVVFGQSSNVIAQFEPSSNWTLSTGYTDSPGDEADYVDYHAMKASGAQGYQLGGTYTSYYWHNNGTYLYPFGQSSIYRWTCSTPYDFKTASSSQNQSFWPELKSIVDFKMNLAGTRYLIACANNNIIRQFETSVAYDITASNVTSTSNFDLTAGSGPSNPSGGFTSHNGDHIYAISGATVYQWDLSSTFNLSTASYIRSQSLSGSPSPGNYRHAFKLSPDGTKLYAFKNQYPQQTYLYEYSLSTPFEINTLGTAKIRLYEDISTHAPPLVQSLGVNISDNGFYFAPYYSYFSLLFRNCDFVTSGLIHHLDAGNSSSYSGSGTTWTDLSSSGNNGTISGATYNSGNGGYFDFNGINDSVETSSDMFNPNANFTFSSWVNADTTTGTHTVVSDRTDVGSFQLRISGGNWQIVDSYQIDVGMFNASGPVATDYWYNITVTRSSNTYSLYINGRFVSSLTSSNVYSIGPQELGVNYTGVEEWDGKISQVMSYNRALSATEVLQNFNHFKHRYSN